MFYAIVTKKDFHILRSHLSINICRDNDSEMANQSVSLVIAPKQLLK